jgi:hypothetical protein
MVRLDKRDLQALRAIKTGRGHQPSPARTQRLVNEGLVELGKDRPRITLRGRVSLLQRWLPEEMQ